MERSLQELQTPGGISADCRYGRAQMLAEIWVLHLQQARMRMHFS